VTLIRKYVKFNKAVNKNHTTSLSYVINRMSLYFMEYIVCQE